MQRTKALQDHSKVRIQELTSTCQVSKDPLQVKVSAAKICSCSRCEIATSFTLQMKLRRPCNQIDRCDVIEVHHFISLVDSTP